MIDSVVFVNPNLVNDVTGNQDDNGEDMLAYDQINEYQQRQMECIHDWSPDSFTLENVVPILDRHVSLSGNVACGMNPNVTRRSS